MYTNPYDIPRGNNPNDYVYKSTQQAPTNDPHGKTWTLEEQKRKQLQDAINARKKLEQSFVGMPTTEVVVKLGEHDDVISQLSQQLGVGDRTSTQNVASPMSAPDTPSVPTMTAPIPEYSQPETKVPEMTEPIPQYSQPEETGGNSDPYAIQEPRQTPYTNPYDIPWTQEQETRKRLSDATIERDNLQKSFVGMPTTENVVKLGEYDNVIKQLTQELGLGKKEYTPGVDGGWQEDIGEAPSNINIIGDVLSGKWIIDAATGALKWVQDNAEDIGEAYALSQAEEKRLLETPLYELDLEELNARKDIELRDIEDVLDEQEDEELAQLAEQTEQDIQEFVDDYNKNPGIRALFYERYRAVTVEQAAEIVKDNREKEIRQEIHQKYDQSYAAAEKEVQKEYEQPYIVDSMRRLVDYIAQGNKDDVNEYINQALAIILDNEGSLTPAEWPEKGSTGWNQTYVVDLGGVSVEMEVLNEEHLYEYGGDKVGILDFIDKAAILFFPPKAEPINAVLSAKNKQLAERYSAGLTLEAGDVRITVVSPVAFEWEPEGNMGDHKINYQGY